jgi:hypothetical protein
MEAGIETGDIILQLAFITSSLLLCLGYPKFVFVLSYSLQTLSLSLIVFNR